MLIEEETIFFSKVQRTEMTEQNLTNIKQFIVINPA